MTGTFSNHRLSALPCERMFAKCIFADNFVSETIIEENSGTGATAQNRVFEMAAITDKINYEAVYLQQEFFSVVIKFKVPSGVEDNGVLLTSHVNAKDRINIYIYNGAVRAYYTSNIGFQSTFLESATVNDDEWHTLTYVVNNGGNAQYLYLDGNDAVSGMGLMDTIQTSPGAGDYLQIGGGMAEASIQHVRVFESVLSQGDHLDYYNGTIDQMDPVAVWRCDEICNDTIGYKALDKTVNLNDLWLADKVDTAAMPTFDTDKYDFDGVDDYMSNYPALTGDYTVSAVESANASTLPTVTQENVNTFVTSITTAGGFGGRLHNMQLFESVLSEIQLKNAEYKQLYYIDQVLARGLFARLSVEGTGKGVYFLGQSYANWSIVEGLSVPTGAVTQTDTGVTFVNTSALVHAHDGDFDLNRSGTLYVYGDIGATGTLLEKTGCKLEITSSGILLNSSLYANASIDARSIAVTFSPYRLPRFYIDGIYVGDGSVIENVVTSSSDLYIGNQVGLGDATGGKINHVYWGDEPLTDREIVAMDLQSRVISDNPTEEPFATIQDSSTSTDIIQDSHTSTDIIQDAR